MDRGGFAGLLRTRSVLLLVQFRFGGAQADAQSMRI